MLVVQTAYILERFVYSYSPMDKIPCVLDSAAFWHFWASPSHVVHRSPHTLLAFFLFVCFVGSANHIFSRPVVPIPPLTTHTCFGAPWSGGGAVVASFTWACRAFMNMAREVSDLAERPLDDAVHAFDGLSLFNFVVLLL